MKIMLLCSSQGNQIALANKIHQLAPISNIVICNGPSKNQVSFKSRLNRFKQIFGTILTFAIFRKIWFDMLAFYKMKFPNFPLEPSLLVGDINESSVIDLINKERPDLVVVSGTNLLRTEIISAIHKHGRVINLHTGISPYIKGGPNCTNWCLYLKEFGLIGNTVMWLDEGIDSGNIIATEKTSLTGNESLLELHVKVMEHAHNLYLRVICNLLDGKPLNGVPQENMSPSRLFLSKHWGPKQMIIV